MRQLVAGLAIMACNRHLYSAKPNIKKAPININIAKYSNKGINSKIIKQ